MNDERCRDPEFIRISELEAELKHQKQILEVQPKDSVFVAMAKRLENKVRQCPVWISCVDAYPPPKGAYYLVTVNDKHRPVQILYYQFNDKIEWTNDECIEIENVVAWMPLPEPYKPVTY